MPFCSNCGQQLTIGNEKFCPNCGQDLKKGGGAEAAATTTNHNNVRDSINIQDTGGDVFGVGVRGSSNIIGKNIVVGSGTINVSQQELAKIPVPEYASALREFSESVNQQLKGRQIPEEKVKDINNNLNELAKEVQDIKPGEEEQQIDYVKQTQIESKTATTIQKVLDVLPEAAETVSTFTPLAPFSKLIGKGVRQIVDAIAAKRRR
jgi:predicted  nucleic acid-binding Zn-ribbon protein